LRNIGHQRYLVLDIGAVHVYGLLTLGRTRHGTKGREGVDGAPHRVLVLLQYFETILPSVKSL